jgi:predicted dehydrogenase
MRDDTPTTPTSRSQPAGTSRRRLLAATGIAAGQAIALPLLGQRRAQAADDRPVNVGLIGVGSRGGTHLKVLLAQPGVRVVAVCDSKPDRVAAAQEKVVQAGQPQPFGTADWKELVSRADIQAVTSALPVDLHLPCYLDVLKAGKDLYAEKPMCLTLAECDTLVAAAKAAPDRIVQIGFQRRSDPKFLEAMELVHGGDLGRLLEGRVMWSNSWGPLYDWFGKRARSGDWMLEQAVHNWDVLNWAARSKPKRAMGMGRSGFFTDQQPDRDVHDYYSGVLEYENGLIVNIVHSWVSPPGLDREYTQLVGEQGGIDFNTGVVTYRKSTGKPERKVGPEKGPDNTTLAFQAFLRSVRERIPAIAGPEQGRQAVLTCLMMREAVYRGTVITPKDIGA